ncbi:OLC1v1026273C1 [Oldenlandia corymbosa var. corymbosa]|uniref:Glycosyltransferase n=1 Tax=Oldenlandia corymbosa var. corymbosa TaxID=529605 RepID=A0AAV1C6S0_OLDCO|nr:OLC1v1026273C1 [Oldenlandia corymbosa var. corymbosa]
MEQNKKLLRVLMLPWLAHGHISPFLELAKTLTTRNFHIYICSTPVTLASIKKKVDKNYSGSIDLVDLHLPSSPELPPHFHTTNGLPPKLMPALKEAYEKSAPEFSKIVSDLRPDLVIYDYNQPWAAEIASSLNIPAVQFLTASLVFVCYALHMVNNPGEKFPYPEIYLRDYEMKKQDEAKLQLTDEDLKDRDAAIQAMFRSYKIVLSKSFKEIEGKFIDMFSAFSNKKVVSVGPLVQDVTTTDIDNDEDEEIREWLDQKEKGSVVYASFGSEYFLTKEERHAISLGLELSNVNFIWVIRFPVGENKITIEESLPEGFLNRVGNRGKILQGWAPQGKILKHPSTGAFLSHCGWGSVMESMSCGVPVVALPMHIDQPLNARLLTAVGVGVEAVRDDGGNLRSEEIARVIRQVLVDENGEDVRRKAKEMSEIMEKKGDEEIDNVAEELQGLCENKQ